VILKKLHKIFNLLVALSLFTSLLFIPSKVYAASWIQSSQADFESGVLNNVDTSSSSGDVKLARAPGYLYAFRGLSNNFWRYNILLNSWTGLANTPNIINNGGALTYDGGNYVYAFRGANSNNFWRYDIAANSWSSIASVPQNIQDGGSLAYDGGDFIYALRGNNTNRFWKYSISGNSWTTLTNTPRNVRDGGALVFAGSHLYALRGNNTNNFWRYDIAANSWSSMTNTPNTIHDGGALTYDQGNYIYAFRGRFTNNFWRYDIAANSWSSMANSPVIIEDGGSLTFGKNNYIYALRGMTTTNAGKYEISSNSWTAITSTPANVDDGGALTFGGNAFIDSGTIASQVLDTGTVDTIWDLLSWNETLAPSTDITFEVRASNSSFLKNDPAPSWNAVGGASPVNSGLPLGRYLQWRATLTSSNPASTPILHDVTVSYSVSGDIMTVTPTNFAPANINVSSSAAFEKLTLLTNANNATWTNLRVDKLGTASDSDISQVKIYYDDDNNGNFDGTETLIGNGTFSSGISNLNLSPGQTITTTPKNYFIVLEITSTASGDLTIGVQCVSNSYFTVISPDQVSSTNFPLNSSLATINSTISISSPIDLTLSPNVAGISGGTATGETTWNIITNAHNGYSLQWKASTAQMINTDSDLINAYTPTLPDTPETWSINTNVSEWGGRLKSTSTTYDSSKWGIDDGVSSKWLNIRITDYEVVQRNSKTSPSGDFQTIQFKAEVGNNSFQESGHYSTQVTVTAVTL
jgi:hypothetical protein